MASLKYRDPDSSRPTLADLADRRDGIVRPSMGPAPGGGAWMPHGVAWHDSEPYVSPEEELRKYIDWKPPADVATWNPTGPLRKIPPPNVVEIRSTGKEMIPTHRFEPGGIFRRGELKVDYQVIETYSMRAIWGVDPRSSRTEHFLDRSVEACMMAIRGKVFECYGQRWYVKDTETRFIAMGETEYGFIAKRLQPRA